MCVCVCVCVSLLGVRLEENIYNRLDKQKPHRSETEELLGAEMGKASSAFGMDAPEYGERDETREKERERDKEKGWE